MDSCFVCAAAPRTVGLLCGSCAHAIGGEAASELCPEQIHARVSEPVTGALNAVLVDAFGRGHVVTVERASATIGRSAKSDVAVAERTVSLAHAIIEHREKSNAWFIADAQSENGTFVNGDLVARRFPLEPGDKIFIGRRVGFWFIPVDDEERERVAEILRAAVDAPPMDTRTDVRFDDGSALKIRAVTEGGAIASWSDERVQLSELEYELLAVLHTRYVAEAALDVEVRGFVPATQLLEALAFKSDAPTHANLRGLVRKVRKKLAEGDPSLDVIESKKGLGYRLARPLDVG